MKRNYGSTDTPKVECINPSLGKWRVRFDYQNEIDSQGNDHGMSFCEIELWHKPSMPEIKEVILTHENELIDQKIASGFIWKEIPVWLSTENQFNYKAAYDIAVQTNGATLPVTFKFGTSDTPVYHKFSTIEDLSDFYTNALQYVNQTLAEGWDKKDNINWEEYEQYL